MNVRYVPTDECLGVSTDSNIMSRLLTSGRRGISALRKAFKTPECRVPIR
jgi:hypothetical protein